MSDLKQKKVKEPDYVPLWSLRSTRFWISFILMFLVFCAINMRTNIGIAMVCMVNATAVTTKNAENGSHFSAPRNPVCVAKYDTENVADLGYRGSYLWTPEMQGALISSTNYGSIFTIIFAGYIADTYGPRNTCLVALILYSIMTLLSPLLADLNYWGCVFPCLAALIVKWIPKTERSTVVAIYTSGNQLGASVGTFVAAKLCQMTFMGGWPLIFYIYGVLGIACIVLWYIFATNKPEENRFISEKEVRYIKKSIGMNFDQLRKKRKLSEVPWKRMFSSTVTWSVIFNRFAFCWKITIMQMFLPSYFRDVLYLNMTENGLYTALPFVAQLVSKNIIAIYADYLRRTGKVGMTNSTKIMEAFGSFGCGLCIISLILFVDCTTPTLALVILVLFGISAGGLVAGAFTASLCIAPDLSGTLESAAGFMAILSMILASITTGMINQTGSQQEWNIIFGIAAFFVLFSGTFFVIFGSAEIQPWSKFSNANMHPPQIHPTDSIFKKQERDQKEPKKSEEIA